MTSCSSSGRASRRAVDRGVEQDARPRVRDAGAHSARGDVDAVGRLLHENWELKRGLHAGISDADVDRLVRGALARPARPGGKILGAGGGGFLLRLRAAPRRTSGPRALSELREVPFRFAARGTQIMLVER